MNQSRRPGSNRRALDEELRKELLPWQLAANDLFWRIENRLEDNE